MADKKQVCVIHGGMAYASDEDYLRDLREMRIDYERLLFTPSWKAWLAQQLPRYDVLLPSLPGRENAKYDNWALYFSKLEPLLSPEAVLVGHSLGGIFLAKYFVDYPPRKPYRKIILVAAPYDDETSESLGDFKLGGSNGLAVAGREIDLLYSRDDPVVPLSEMDKYLRDVPEAKARVFDERQHFNQPEFRELLDIIKSK